MADFESRPAHCTNCTWGGLIIGGDALGGWNWSCSMCGGKLAPGQRPGSVAAASSAETSREKRRARPAAPLAGAQRDRVVERLLAEARERVGLKPMPPIPGEGNPNQ